MSELMRTLFNPSFMPHGHCYFWVPEILWMHLIGDTLIALSYYSIPVALLYFVYKRQKLRFDWMVILFAIFIFACGTTHIISLITIFDPIYAVQGFVKLLTAGVSVLTAVILWPLIPKALALPSPQALEYSNAQLALEEAQRRKTEGELQRSHEDLELRVGERTKELNSLNAALQKEVAERKKTQTDLQRYAAALERTNLELEQFAYAASHDLREPLRMIGGFSELLRKRYSSLFDAEAEKLFSFVIDGVKRMDALTSDLLIYSRLSSEDRKTECFSMEKALQLSLTNLHIAIDEVKPTLTYGSLPEVQGDLLQMVRVLQNLIGNSIKFKSSEPLTIHLEAVERDSFWEFSVKDNGIGFDARHANRVFEIFKRLHPTHTYPGTGIGLSICKMIVERHGGKMWADSADNPGAQFFFTLPKEPPASPYLIGAAAKQRDLS